MGEMYDDSNSSRGMRGIVPESSLKFWILLDADRWWVSFGILSTIFLLLVVIGTIQPVSVQNLIGEGDPTETLFQALLTAIITSVTLVLTLSQLILSQELGALGDQRERMEGSLSFRRDAEDVLDVDISPTEPSEFLREFVNATKKKAETFRKSTQSQSLEDRSDEKIESYVEEVVDDADSVSEQLDDSSFGEFEVVRAALNYNYSRKIYLGRKIREESDLSDESDSVLGDLIKTLEMFGPAREHFKTLYFQWELANLSRAILYTSIPSLVVTISMLIFFTPTNGTEILGMNTSLLVLYLAITVSLTPFIVLLSYILRIVTAAKRTLSIGPFILRG